LPPVGSIGGLLAASALAPSYGRVTVIDRDELPDGIEHRRAVPQGRHVHGLLPAGRVKLDSLLPGLGAELIAAGAPTCDVLEQLRWILNGFEMTRAPTGLQAILTSRPFIEGHLRRRVRALPGVEFVERCEALDLVPCCGGQRVTGVRVALDGVQRTLEADLVVCATGRAAQVPAWLEGLGFPRVRHERLAVDIKYRSRRLRLPTGALGGDRMVLVGALAGRPRALALFAQENDEWILTVAGYGAAHRPPGDDAGFGDFAASVAPPDVVAAVREADPLAPIATHGFPASRRWRYDRLERFPGRTARARRRHLVLQPALRAGHDHCRRPRRGAARLPARGRRTVTGETFLRLRLAADRRRLAPFYRRRPGAAGGPRSPPAGGARRQPLPAQPQRGRRARSGRRRRVHGDRDHGGAPSARAPPRRRAPRRARPIARAARTR
jgi:hypothetical protein